MNKRNFKIVALASLVVGITPGVVICFLALLGLVFKETQVNAAAILTATGIFLACVFSITASELKK